MRREIIIDDPSSRFEDLIGSMKGRGFGKQKRLLKVVLPTRHSTAVISSLPSPPPSLHLNHASTLGSLHLQHPSSSTYPTPSSPANNHFTHRFEFPFPLRRQTYLDVMRCFSSTSVNFRYSSTNGRTHPFPHEGCSQIKRGSP